VVEVADGSGYDNRSETERSKLRRELSRFDTVFFLISAMVVVDTIGAIAVGGAQAFTWLLVLFVLFFPSPAAPTSVPPPATSLVDPW
jgi:hypothetical protein